MGLFIVIFSLASDFIFITGNVFYLGYAQVGLIIFGLFFIILSHYINIANPLKKFWYLFLGADFRENIISE